MKFTKEEVSLCKQVAERHRKDIEYGDWMIIEGDPHVVPTLFIGQDFPKTKRTMLPLWTITDCLGFLKEKGYRVRLDEDKDVELINKTIELDPFSVSCYGHKSKRSFFRYGKTLIEACLKAVLAVLEEE